MRGSLYAEFRSPEDILAGAKRLRALGYTRLNAITPFHMPHLEELLGVKRTKLPIFVFGAGLSGAALMYLVQWYTNVIDYPYNSGGRPLNSVVSDIPLMYETAIALAGATAFGLMFLLNGLPRLWTPITEVEGSERTTIDRYWLEIDYSDPLYDPGVLDELEGAGAVAFREARR